MCASQVAHTSTEICNWSTDPSMRNILTVEVRTDTSCTDELLGSSCGDFTIWSSTLEVPYAFQRWHNKLFASGFNGRLLPTLSGYRAQGHVLHFRKPPINICLKPVCQGGCSVLRVCQVMLRSWGLPNKLLYASDLLWAQLYISTLLLQLCH